MRENNEKLLTVAEAADHLRVAPATIRRLCNANRIPAIRVGRFFRFSPAALRGLATQPTVLS